MVILGLQLAAAAGGAIVSPQTDTWNAGTSTTKLKALGRITLH